MGNSYLENIWNILIRYQSFVFSFITVLLTVVLGLIIHKILYPRLRKRFARSKNRNARLIIRTLEGVSDVWLLLIMLYVLLVINNYPHKIEQFVQITLLVTLVFSLTIFIDRFARESVNYYVRKGRIPKTSIFQTIVRISVLIFGIFVILSLLGVSFTALIATLGIGGLAIALALQPTFANVFGGMFLLATKQINVGDYIELGTNEEGFIEDINWRTTSIRTVHNNLIIIPNSNLANITIRNYTYPEGEMTLLVPIGVHYNSDLELVEKVTLSVAKDIQTTVQGAVKEFEPTMRYREFAASSINFNVGLRISEFTSRFQIRHEFIKRLMLAYRENGIVIPFPITTVEFPIDTSLELKGSPIYDV